MNNLRFIGMDVHAETIAVAETANGITRTIGVIPNQIESIRKLFKKFGNLDNIRACYEAGPCGYVLYWQLTKLGVSCVVVAPTLVPVKPGDRIKTDRRDAEKLARCFSTNELTPVWVPDAEHEALRDLVRTREQAHRDQTRARHRMRCFLLRHGLRCPDKTTAWASWHMEWLHRIHFEQSFLETTKAELLAEVEHAHARVIRLDQVLDEAVTQAPVILQEIIAGLQALRGVSKLSAIILAVEIGHFSRFQKAQHLMGYAGVIPSEYSSGKTTHRGGITKTGNSRLRRILIEAAWAYRHAPRRTGAIAKRQRDLKTDAHLQEISWKAQHRLHRKFARMLMCGKTKPPIVTAVGRELAGFVWAIGVDVERKCASKQ